MFSLNIPVELTLAIAGIKGKRPRWTWGIHLLAHREKKSAPGRFCFWMVPPQKKTRSVPFFFFSYNISTLPSDIATSIKYMYTCIWREGKKKWRSGFSSTRRNEGKRNIHVVLQTPRIVFRFPVFFNFTLPLLVVRCLWTADRPCLSGLLKLILPLFLFSQSSEYNFLLFIVSR